MSLFSFISNNGSSILVGDLALTTEESVTPIFIPLHNQEYNAEDFADGRAPYKWALKTIVIKDLLCLGAVGFVDRIITLFRTVEDFFIHREVTHDNLMLFLNNGANFSDFGGCSALFALCNIINDAKRVEVYGKGTIAPKIKNHPTYGQVASIGTGAEVWNEKFNEDCTLNSEGTSNPSKVLSNVLLSVMHFLEEERLTPENLQDGWGGGFNITYVEEFKFRKLDNMGFVWWFLDISEEIWEPKPVSLVRFSYKGKNLFIQHFNKNDYKAYGIRPIHDKIDIEDQPTALEFDCYTVTSCIYVFRGPERIYTIFLVNSINNSEPLIHAREIDGLTAFGWQAKLETALIDLVRVTVADDR